MEAEAAVEAEAAEGIITVDHHYWWVAILATFTLSHTLPHNIPANGSACQTTGLDRLPPNQTVH